MGLTYQDPPPEEEGISINFGFSNLSIVNCFYDVLKKCNENEDDARAGEFCATNSSIFIPGITAELTQKIATELRTNHLESFEIAAKRIEFLRTEFVLFGFSTD